MRLKSVDGPLSVYNGNDPNTLNSPKRLNTVQNSNVTTGFAANLINSTSIITNNINNTNDNNTTLTTTGDVDINTEDTVQWCNPPIAQERELSNNAKNRAQSFNINNNLAASLRGSRFGTVASIYTESSPDDSLLDYEEAHQSSSSIDASPQDDEDRGFDISDSESLSDEGNLNTRDTLQRRGIVNPNYPGFQHLAHTLDYSIKALSDTDFTDDDFEYESTAKLNAEANNINNNNNEDDVEYKIDSVNRLDSVENIQKVFYDKPVFNIPLQCDSLKCNNDLPSGSNSNSNQGSDDDFELANGYAIHSTKVNEEFPDASNNSNNIVGDFGREVEEELGKLNAGDAIVFERAIEEDLKEAVEKLSTSNDLEPSAAKCSIQPNTQQPFNKLPLFNKAEINSVLLEEPIVIKQNANMTSVLQHNPLCPDLNNHRTKLNNETDCCMKSYNIKISDAFLSGVHDDIPEVPQIPNFFVENLNGNITRHFGNFEDSNRKYEELEKFCKEDQNKDDKDKDEKEEVVPRKKEKMGESFVKKRRDYSQQFGSLITVPRREFGGRNRENLNRRSAPTTGTRADNNKNKKHSPENFGAFDVYNIETAMPKIDLDAIESHLRAARVEERRRRTDREEIRRRLAMGGEEEYYSDRPGRKPSLQARLQSGMNLQICFMNETASDTDSPSSDSECPMTNPKEQRMSPKIRKTPVEFEEISVPVRPASLSIGQPLLQPVTEPMPETDFFTRQARLQTEARMALAQAKEMARMQMEIERQRQVKSPITEMVRHSLEKVGIPFPEERRRLSRQILTEMNVAQLQVIVNDLHTQIETLNEVLVKFLMERDDLHMEQDSMLVDIEDLTRYLGAKEQTIKDQTRQNNNLPTPGIGTNLSSLSTSPPRSPLIALNSSVKPHLHRIAGFVKK